MTDLSLCEHLCDHSHMATNLDIDPRLLARAVEVSGERTKTAAVTRALREYVARHEQKRLVELFAALEWDPEFDYKAERSRS
jgi:Arc/MetJ family transcription regulator